MGHFFAMGLLTGALVIAAEVAGQGREQANQEARAIFKELIEINTTNSTGNVTLAAEAMAKRLREAGYPQEDVIEALPSDWSVDPFVFLERDGYFYGRGTEDMKESDAILVTNFARLKREGFEPDRDLILALTADEEGGRYNGIDWLLREHRDWIDAEYCINLDGGEFEKLGGKRVLVGLQASEKVYADFQLETTNSGGHSSVPGADNAIYELAEALTKIEKFSFPVEINEVTRNYFARSAALAAGTMAADLRGAAAEPPDAGAIKRLSAIPYYNSLLRTTCNEL